MVLTTVIQIIIALGILNVWLLRYGKPTAWRGGDAKNMHEEFEAYGLPEWSMLVVGGLKVLFAVMLIAGIWIPSTVGPAALGIAVLMAGAVVMHFRIGDPPKKSMPAATMLVLALFLLFS